MQRVEMPLGRFTLSIETGRLAKQSDGSIQASWADEAGVSSYRLGASPYPWGPFDQQIGQTSSGNPGITIGAATLWRFYVVQGINACGVGP